MKSLVTPRQFRLLTQAVVAMMLASQLSGCGAFKPAEESSETKRAGADATPVDIDKKTGGFSLRMPKKQKKGHRTQTVEIIVEGQASSCYPGMDGSGGDDWAGHGDLQADDGGDGDIEEEGRYESDETKPSYGSPLRPDRCQEECSSPYYNVYSFDYAEGKTLQIDDLPIDSYHVTVILKGDIEERGDGWVDVQAGQTSYLQIVLGSVSGNGRVVIDVIRGGDIEPTPGPMPVPEPSLESPAQGRANS